MHHFNNMFRWFFRGMTSVTVECIGVDPPCVNCKRFEENAREAANNLKAEGIEVKVVKVDIMSPGLIDRYGLLMSPSLVVNSVLRVNGKVPDVKMVERFIREAHKNKQLTNELHQ